MLMFLRCFACNGLCRPSPSRFPSLFHCAAIRLLAWTWRFAFSPGNSRPRARINRMRSYRVNSHAWSSSIETEIQLDSAILLSLSQRIARKPIVAYTVIWESLLPWNTLRDRKRFDASITLSISVRRDDVIPEDKCQAAVLQCRAIGNR